MPRAKRPPFFHNLHRHKSSGPSVWIFPYRFLLLRVLVFDHLFPGERRTLPIPFATLYQGEMPFRAQFVFLRRVREDRGRYARPLPSLCLSSEPTQMSRGGIKKGTSCLRQHSERYDRLDGRECKVGRHRRTQ